MRLYGYWRSSSAWRVRIALALKAIDYEYAPVHLVREGGEQNRPDYLALNPAGQVPMLELEHEGRALRLTQSLVIMDYLDAVFPEPRLWPDDLVLRCRARECAEICNSGLQPLHNARTLIEVERLGGTRVEWARHFLPRGLAALEAIATETSGRYLIGDQVTGADVCLAPQLFAVRRYDVDLEPYPHLRRIDAALSEHPAFIASRPENQPDARAKN